MKTIIVLLILCPVLSFGQKENLLVNGELPLDSFYQDKSTMLIFSNVSLFDSLKQGALVTKVNNWGATHFNNLKEVLVGETDDQLTFNFIDKSYYIKSLGIKTAMSWYIRLTIQFKDGKIKYSFYDDGNLRTSVLRDKQYFFKAYFKGDDPTMIARGPNKDGMLKVYENQKDLIASLNKYILTSSAVSDF